MTPHRETITATRITGLHTAWRNTSPKAGQVVMSSHWSPKLTRMGESNATATWAQNTGFFKRTFQLIFIKLSFLLFQQGQAVFALVQPPVLAVDAAVQQPLDLLPFF